MIDKSPSLIKEAYRLSIAPMLDCTDRHFRVIMRQISTRVLLYTEMVVAKALQYEKGRKLLQFNEIEHPISLQVGGDDPKILAEAARLAESLGYDEINLNIGCPSPRVQSGNFGACLMADPNQVAKCIEAMAGASNLPVTIKHRTGIDNLDSYEFLLEFIDIIASAGATRFAIHARKAFLKGLNPKENRKIPPLEYEKVAQIKRDRPDLKIELNGGLHTPEECIKALKKFDGAMVGRAIYSNPLLWKDVDYLIYGENYKSVVASEVIQKIIPYAEEHLKKNGRLWDYCKHLLHLVQGVPGAKSWRQSITLKAQKANADLNILENAAKELKKEGL